MFILACTLDEDRLGTAPKGEEVEFEILEISDAIADLLTVREGGKWHKATPEEAAAEREHSHRISERFRRQEASFDWTMKHRKKPR